jgi:hypothetical protein
MRGENREGGRGENREGGRGGEKEWEEKERTYRIIRLK